MSRRKEKEKLEIFRDRIRLLLNSFQSDLPIVLKEKFKDELESGDIEKIESVQAYIQAMQSVADGIVEGFDKDYLDTIIEDILDEK